MNSIPNIKDMPARDLCIRLDALGCISQSGYYWTVESTGKLYILSPYFLFDRDGTALKNIYGPDPIENLIPVYTYSDFLKPKLAKYNFNKIIAPGSRHKKSKDNFCQRCGLYTQHSHYTLCYMDLRKRFFDSATPWDMIRALILA